MEWNPGQMKNINIERQGASLELGLGPLQTSLVRKGGRDHCSANSG